MTVVRCLYDFNYLVVAVIVSVTWDIPTSYYFGQLHVEGIFDLFFSHS